jgi:hypothetical protein
MVTSTGKLAAICTSGASKLPVGEGGNSCPAIETTRTSGGGVVGTNNAYGAARTTALGPA